MVVPAGLCLTHFGSHLSASICVKGSHFGIQWPKLQSGYCAACHLVSLLLKPIN